MPSSLPTSTADRSRAPRVLTVLPDFPWPAKTGLHLRHLSNLDLLHRLGCYSALLYFTTEEHDPPPLAVTPLTCICDEVHHGGRRFPHAAFSTASLISHKLDFLARGALGIPGKRYPFSMSYDRIGAGQIVVAEAQRIAPDYVILASLFMHYSAALRERGYKVIIDAADVLTNLSASFLADLNGRGGKLGLYANYLACRSQERIFLKQCSEVWATSEAEADELRRIVRGVRAVVVPNGLDERQVRPSAQQPQAIVGFIGTYSYAPNLEAARFLAEMVFPRVLRECPDAVLRLAGAGMPEPEAERLGKLPHVEVVGGVEDSGRFMDECAVLAMPVLLRGGVPLKLIEAMARGKAIVASPELVAGINVTDSRELLVRDAPHGFADAIVTLLRDTALRERVGSCARAAFVRDFSLSSVEGRLRHESVLAQHEKISAPKDAVLR